MYKNALRIDGCRNIKYNEQSKLYYTNRCLDFFF